MAAPTDDELTAALADIARDAFNRSINALAASGAIDLSKLHSDYTAESRYYGMVTEQLEYTVRSGAKTIRSLFSESGEARVPP